MIESERLLLRPHRPEDFDVSHAMWSDPRVVEHISGVPSTRQQSWTRILTGIGHWSVCPFGPLVVEEKLGGTFVGEVGLFNFKRDIVPSIDDVPEAGWVLAPAMQGRGYATEAVRAVLDWADTALEAPRIVAIVSEANATSLHVAAKAGFRQWQRTTYMEKPVILFERARCP
jgi:RimJ/RimL family protein N-acetyltransferase